MTTPDPPDWSADAPHFLAYQRFRQEHPELFGPVENDPLPLQLEPGEIASTQRQAERRLASAGLSPAWASIGVVFEDEYLKVVRDAVRFPGGDLGTYVRVFPQDLQRPGVAVLPVCQGKVVLVRHFRHATRKWHWEIPRGFGSASDPQQSAITELGEELGARPTRLVELGTLHVDSGVLWHETALYFAEISDFRHTADPHEAIDRAEAFALEDVRRDIGENRITDSFTIAAFMRANLRGLLGTGISFVPSNLDLGTLGGTVSEATGINPAGKVVGRSDMESGQVHATLWTFR